MIRIDILTIFPGFFHGPFDLSIIKRAREKGLVDLHMHDIRDYAADKHQRVDDYAFSGEAGMVMMIGPIARAIEQLQGERQYDEILYTSPDGQQFNQGMANEFSMKRNFIILCGHYKGVDHRVREHFITREVSIGDYVMTGGELAAAVIVDSVVRLVPGVISDSTSALNDSFQDNLLAPPVYTRPAEFRGWRVPGVLLSGNDKAIEEWKEEQSLERTRKLRPDLLG